MDFISIKKIRSRTSYGLRNTNEMHIAAMNNTKDIIIMANYITHIINLRIHYIVLNSSTIDLLIHKPDYEDRLNNYAHYHA